jgi:hypothetical protein
MCITVQRADLSKTILLAHALEDGRNIVGYQNRAKNRSRVPNAMLLPFPSLTPMTRKNCFDLSSQPKLFHDYAELVQPEQTRSRGLSKGTNFLDIPRAEVFDSGSYTVVLAQDARAIPAAIEQVPANKRPALHPELFDAYAQWYPGWSIALCCWDGEIEAEPLLWWYDPLPAYREHHFLPGLDGHDGTVPDPARKSVAVDHTIVVGAPVFRAAAPNARHILKGVGDELRGVLPENVYGGVLQQQMRNGDWKLPKEGWSRWSALDRLQEPREKPPGFGAT